MSFKLFITIFIILFISKSCEEKKFPKRQIYLHGIECEYNSKYIQFFKCYIKAVRNKTGLLNLYNIPRNPLDNILVSAQLLYRFGTIYRQFLLKIDYDACALASGISSGKILDLATKFYKAYDPDMFKPCPNMV